MSGVSDGSEKKMAEIEKQELEFYKNDTAESILIGNPKFKFSRIS